MSDPTDPEAPETPEETPAKGPGSLTVLRERLRPPTSGSFKPGPDARRARGGAKRNVAETIRVATQNLSAQLQYLIELSDPAQFHKHPDATHADRRDAVKTLLDRVLGKATETVVQANESAEDPLAGLSPEEIHELARKHAQRS